MFPRLGVGIEILDEHVALLNRGLDASEYLGNNTTDQVAQIGNVILPICFPHFELSTVLFPLNPELLLILK